MATLTWTGNATAVKQIDTITVANTWAAADTVTLTINSKDLVITIGSLVTTSQVATTIQQAIENIAFTDSTASRNLTNGKQDFPELNEVIATVNAAIVTLTARVAGKPFTLSVTEVTAGNGTSAEATATAATGPNHFDNADNWTTATAPSSNDNLHFNQSANADCLYALSTGLAIANIRVQGFRRHIGLPFINADDPARPYAEYRTTHLTYTGVSNYLDVDAPNAGRIFFNCPTIPINIIRGGNDLAGGVPSIQVVGSTVVSGHIRSGHVGIGYRGEDTTVVGAVLVQGGKVTIGNGSSGGAASAITQLAGIVVMDTGIGTGTSFDVTLSGGELIANGGYIGAITISGGVMRYNSIAPEGGTITLRGNGHLDFTDQPDSIAVPVIERYSNDSKVSDPNGKVASLIVDNNQVNNTSNLDIGYNYKITRAAVT